MALTPPRARQVTFGASPQVPLPFLGVCKPSPRHFGVEKGGRTGLALHHFGSSEVNSRLAGMSLGQRVPQCPQPYWRRLPVFALCSFPEGTAVGERGENTQGVGVEVGRAARWD